VLSRQAKQREAAVAFDRAAGLDPSYAGISGLYAGAPGRASRTASRRRRRSSARAMRIRTRSGVARAQAELEQLDAANRRHVWAKLRGGVEHDSNVTLQNEYVFGRFPDFQPRNERDDTVAVFEGEAGLEFYRDEQQSRAGRRVQRQRARQRPPSSTCSIRG
jgi:hypothetical protein